MSYLPLKNILSNNKLLSLIGSNNKATLKLVIPTATVLIIAIIGYWLVTNKTAETAIAESTPLADSIPAEQLSEPTESTTPAPAATGYSRRDINEDYGQQEELTDAAEVSLYNCPLTYTGTVTPGGVASLNVIIFQNGRIEGTLDYSGGKSMPAFGSYTWDDSGKSMKINLTISDNADPGYSESWSGSTSVIKENLSHTLNFKQINTSNGDSKTAVFALRQ